MDQFEAATQKREQSQKIIDTKIDSATVGAESLLNTWISFEDKILGQSLEGQFIRKDKEFIRVLDSSGTSAPASPRFVQSTGTETGDAAISPRTHRPHSPRGSASVRYEEEQQKMQMLAKKSDESLPERLLVELPDAHNMRKAMNSQRLVAAYGYLQNNDWFTAIVGTLLEQMRQKFLREAVPSSIIKLVAVLQLVICVGFPVDKETFYVVMNHCIADKDDYKRAVVSAVLMAVAEHVELPFIQLLDHLIKQGITPCPELINNIVNAKIVSRKEEIQP